MPPRTSVRGTARPGIRGARGGRQVRGRGRGGKYKSKEVKVEPIIVEEIPPEKPKIETWVDRIPIFPPPPDQKLHEKMSKERKEKRHQKVLGYCREEVMSMINFAFATRIDMRDENFKNTRKSRSIRASFQKGEFLPPQKDTPVHVDVKEKVVPLEPMHSIDIENYLHFQSGPFYDDLSRIFNVKISEDFLGDPNEPFSAFINRIQDSASQLPKTFEPERPEFPFILSIIGPQASGVTTVCQLLMSAFAPTVIEAVYSPPVEPPKNRRKSELEVSTTIKIAKQHLTNAIIINYSDDKSAVAQIAAAIRDNASSGIIITGFPNTKAQCTALERAISSSPQIRPNSSRSIEKPKSLDRSITGFIFTSHIPQQTDERMIDPETGFCFSKGFHSPSTAELCGDRIDNLLKHRTEIENRLIPYQIHLTPPPSAKAQQQMSTFESAMRKTYQVVGIGTCKTDMELADILDTFISTLMQRETHYIRNVLDPEFIHLPLACSDALLVWRDCLEEFGRPIADQNRLIRTIGDKISNLTECAVSRFQLLTSLRDARQSIKESDCKSHDDFFNAIWDESIKVRNNNIHFASTIVEKSGLVDLVFSLMNSPKIVFLALVCRMTYVYWFHNNFSKVFETAKTFDIFRDITKLNKVPSFDFSCSQSDEVAASEEKLTMSKVPLDKEEKMKRRQKVEQKGINYLNLFFEKKEFNIKTQSFDAKRVCQALDIPLFEEKYSFDDTRDYAEAFLLHVKENTTDAILKKECDAISVIFNNVNDRVRSIEIEIVNSVFDLNDFLVEYAFKKFTIEMEQFSSTFNFKYDFSIVNESNLGLSKVANSLECKNIEKILPKDVVKCIKEHTNTMKCVSLKEMLHLIENDVDKQSLELVSLLIKIIECSECFDPNAFVALFE